AAWLIASLSLFWTSAMKVLAGDVCGSLAGNKVRLYHDDVQAGSRPRSPQPGRSDDLTGPNRPLRPREAGADPASRRRVARHFRSPPEQRREGRHAALGVP